MCVYVCVCCMYLHCAQLNKRSIHLGCVSHMWRVNWKQYYYFPEFCGYFFLAPSPFCVCKFAQMSALTTIFLFIPHIWLRFCFWAFFSLFVVMRRFCYWRLFWHSKLTDMCERTLVRFGMHLLFKLRTIYLLICLHM